MERLEKRKKCKSGFTSQHENRRNRNSLISKFKLFTLNDSWVCCEVGKNIGEECEKLFTCVIQYKGGEKRNCVSQ